MPGFFDAIACESNAPRLAAWGLEGRAAGTRALFSFEDGRYAPIYRDAGFPDPLVQEISRQEPGRVDMLSCEGMRVFLEPIAGRRQLVICGAGHVSLCVIRLAAALDYTVTAIEDREVYAEKARNAGAELVIRQPFTEALDQIRGGPGTAFVVMTREHIHDVACLRLILKKPRAYLGAMGSHSRSGEIRRLLEQEGFDPGDIASLHMPIGLSIGARTPEEIAISVMAEIISVMNADDPGEAYPPGLLPALIALEDSDDHAVLATIVGKHGEAPRRPGARMLVYPDGRTLGTIGGGYAEAEILRMAGELLREGCRDCQLTRISMKKGVMHCGGEIEVLLLPL